MPFALHAEREPVWLWPLQTAHVARIKELVIRRARKIVAPDLQGKRAPYT